MTSNCEAHLHFLFFRFGASTIQLNKLVPLICKLVSDSNGTVNIPIKWIYLYTFLFFP
jgi:hypothetical protein